MTANEAVNWIINLSADIGKYEHRDLWHYEQALDEIRELLECVSSPEKTQLSPEGATKDATFDLISRQAALDALGERPLTWTEDLYELGCRNQYDADRLAIETVPSAQQRPEQWQELKETVIELRDNDGTGTQHDVCAFLVNYMNILEKQMREEQNE